MVVSLFIIIGIVAAFMFAYKTYNVLVTLVEPVKSADATLDGSLTNKRSLGVQLLTLAEMVAQNERGTNLAIARALQETAQAVASGNSTPTIVIAQLAAQYPVLNSYNAFVTVQNSALNVEQRVEAALTVRNKLAAEYNVAVSRFPNNIVAGMFGRGPVEYRTAAVALPQLPQHYSPVVIEADPKPVLTGRASPVPPSAGPNRLAAEHRLERRSRENP